MGADSDAPVGACAVVFMVALGVGAAAALSTVVAVNEQPASAAITANAATRDLKLLVAASICVILCISVIQ